MSDETLFGRTCPACGDELDPHWLVVGSEPSGDMLARVGVCSGCPEMVYLDETRKDEGLAAV